MGLDLHCIFLPKPDFQRVSCIHNFTTHSILLNHYNNRQTVNPMAAVDLMCRDSGSSLLLSLTPKLYPALFFIMVKLNQWWWWDVNLMHGRPHKVFTWDLPNIVLQLPTSYFICDLVTNVRHWATGTFGYVTYVTSRVHNIRGRGEYPTSLVWPNALRKLMT